MKRILAVSDSHGNTGMLWQLVDHIEENPYDFIFHLGDFKRDAEWLEEHLNREVLKVPGNCDFFDFSEREVFLRVGKFRILGTHGDKQGVKTSPDRLSYHAEETGCNVALFGHTHEPFTGYVGSVLMVNPGTLLNGRFARIEIEGDRIDPRIMRL